MQRPKAHSGSEKGLRAAATAGGRKKEQSDSHTQTQKKKKKTFSVLQYTDGTDAFNATARLPSTPPPQPGSVKAWSAADQGRLRAPAWTLTSSSSPSPLSAAHLPPGYSDLRPPATNAPEIRFNITQPLLEQTGQMRWALNNVATGLTPSCGSFLETAQKRGLGWVRGEAEATAAKGAAADDDLLGKQTVTDTTFAPTFLAGVGPPLATPSVGRLVVALDAGSVVDLVFDNLPANANGGDYRGGGVGANRTTSEMHPIHWHGYHGWLLGTGAQGSGPFTDSDRAALNYYDPSLRDSITILPDSWAVVRLTLASPGAWLMHCHMHSHLGMGMAAVLLIGLDALGARKDSDFPACARECPASTAPWTPATVRAEWGHTPYDLGPDTLPMPNADGAVAPAVGGEVNASSVPP